MSNHFNKKREAIRKSLEDLEEEERRLKNDVIWKLENDLSEAKESLSALEEAKRAVIVSHEEVEKYFKRGNLDGRGETLEYIYIIEPYDEEHARVLLVEETINMYLSGRIFSISISRMSWFRILDSLDVGREVEIYTPYVEITREEFMEQYIRILKEVEKQSGVTTF